MRNGTSFKISTAASSERGSASRSANGKSQCGSGVCQVGPAMATEFESVFVRLRAILQKHAGTLSVKHDTPTALCLEGGVHPTHKTAFPIAWVEFGKAYVSYHFMPVYANPKLLDGFSAKLKARMRAKSCFNFESCDEDLFTELEQLTVKGFAAFKNAPFMREAKLQKA
jgi:hypothetical protein